MEGHKQFNTHAFIKISGRGANLHSRWIIIPDVWSQWPYIFQTTVITMYTKKVHEATNVKHNVHAPYNES